MLMPVLRLLLIYAVLAFAVAGVFERDSILRIIRGDAPARTATAEPETEGTEAAEAPASVPVPADDPAAAPAPEEDPSSASPVSGALADAAPPLPPEFPPAAAPDTNDHLADLQTPVADPAQSTDPTPEPADTEPAEEPVSGSLADARNAYWRGDYRTAGAILTALAAAEPESADAFGELGNFQYARRDFEGAAESYLRAGTLLAAQGQAARAQELVAVLGQLDPARAARLSRAIQGN